MKCPVRSTVVTALLLVLVEFPVHCQLLGWKKKIDVSGIGNPLSYNPSNHRTIYGPGLSNSEGVIMVSYDRGGAWQTLSVVAGGSRVKSIIIDPLDTLTILVGQEGVTSDRVMKSTDGGLTWTATLSGDFSFYGVPIEFNESHPDTVFTMMGSKLYKSIDFGSTWTIVNGNTGFNPWCDAALRPDSVDIIYVGDNSSGIWKTTDGGISFRLVCQTTGEIPMIAIDRRDPSVAYATKFGGGGGMLKSTDYGETWVPMIQFNGVQCWGVSLGVDQPELILMGTYSPPYSTYYSTDNGSNWKEVSCGLTSLLNYGALALDSSAMFILQADGMYALQRINLALQPTSTIRGRVEDSLTHAPIDADVTISYARCDTPASMTIHTDTSGGFSFDNLTISDPPVLSDYTVGISPSLPYGHLSIAPVHLDTAVNAGFYHPGTADVFLSGEDSNGYSRFYQAALDSLGIKWNFWNTLVKGTPPYAQCPGLKKDIAIFFSGNTASPLDSATLGDLATAFTGGTGLFITGQDIVEKNESASLFAGVLKIGFAANTSDSYVTGTAGDLMDTLAFFTSGGSGAQNQTSRDVLRALSGGTVPMMDYVGVSDTVHAAMRIASGNGSGRAIVAGFGFEAINAPEQRKEMMRRVIGYLDGSIIVGVESYRRESLPLEPRLEQNYPNPFNPSTEIRYVIRDAGVVRLTVYDVLGREIATLVNERKAPGEYSVSWDASRMPSGMYFARILAGSHWEVKKMNLVK